jgi:hypothetical protein
MPDDEQGLMRVGRRHDHAPVQPAVTVTTPAVAALFSFSVTRPIVHRDGAPGSDARPLRFTD